MSGKKIIALLVLAAVAASQATLTARFWVADQPWFEWINFATLAVLTIAIFEKRRRGFSWLAAIAAGFFLDIYSQRFFGFWIILLLAAVAAVKFAVKKYVRIPSYW